MTNEILKFPIGLELNTATFEKFMRKEDVEGINSFLVPVFKSHRKR